MSNIVAIVGRPNVGKSTLFNRLIGSRKAIVNEESGVTRDRNYGKSEWCGKEFSVIDTGGYVSNSDDIFEEEINKQVLLALDEADVILFMVDTEIGLTGLDENFAKLLRNIQKPVYLVANKVDTGERIYDASEFYRLGINSELYCISSANGFGTGELLDAICSHFTEEKAEDTNHLPHIAIVGRPNVGKSSTINALIGEERNIVTEIAGTTRDSLYTRYNRFGHDFILVDTAGMRKKAKVIAPFRDVDIIFTSALTKQRLLKALEAAIKVYENRTQKLKTSELNRVMLEAIESYPPPMTKGKSVKIKYVTQLPTHAPSFAFYCNLPQYVKETYKRYLENKIRENWDFTGVPIQLFMRKK